MCHGDLSPAPLAVERDRHRTPHTPALDWGRTVTYFCFIESKLSSVPHMEPLPVDDAETAIEKTRRLMSEHPSAVAAHVFRGEERIATLTVSDVAPA